MKKLELGQGVPLVGANGPDFASSFQAIVTFVTSTSVREKILAASDFPLPGDLPAFLLVNQLVFRGAARPTDMADAIQTGRSNVSKIVRRLEDAGLVFRASDPRDDRAVVIALTDLGLEVGARILTASEYVYGAAPEGWSPEELATLETLIVKLALTLDAVPGHPLSAAAGVDLRADRKL